jgi:hypothetical protein
MQVSTFKDSKAILITSVISLLCSLGLFIVAITRFGIDEKGELLSVLLMLFFFLFAGVYLLVHYLNYHLTIMPDKIVFQKVFGGPIEIDIKDIITLVQNKARTLLTIETQNKRIKINITYILFNYKYEFDVLNERSDIRAFFLELNRLSKKDN